MLSTALPEMKRIGLDLPHFPTRQQIVVWRNWGLAPVERIAAVLGTTEGNITRLAEDMGLRTPGTPDEKWLQRGYITIIRANWHLLSYRQLLLLLGWPEEKLASVLKQDDFLSVKMGNFKPEGEEAVYAPLTEAQKRRTGEIKNIIQKHFPDFKDKKPAEPFGFLKEFELQAPERMEYGMPDRDEAVIGGQWRVIGPGNAKHVDEFIERFIARHESRWGIKLEPSVDKGPGRNMILETTAGDGRLSESHTIEITDQNIYIKAVDEAGLLRGLQWMEKAMDSRGGPFLEKGLIRRETRIDTRIVHAYSAVFGDPLLETEMDPYPEGLLAKLSELGVNGIWLHGVLYTLVPWEEAPELSTGWEKRMDGLRMLIKKAAGYGIGVYLYMNEPRAMPQAFFEKHPDWKGHARGEYACLCTSAKPVRDFLRNGIGKLFEEAPGLAGIITITMSENLTNCYSCVNGQTNCPRCSSREPQEVISEVNRLIAEGAHSVNPDAKIITWTWGWQNPCGRDRLWIKDAIGLLPEDVRVMCTSEEAVETDIAGVKGSVLDYSISVPGPGRRARENWAFAADRGLKAMAKVQFNNTWECSFVPYMPAPALLIQHLERLMDAGVTGLMLGWSLGGYPSLNLEIAAQYYWKQENCITSLPEISQNKFGDLAGKKVYEAWECFSKAFKEFPFDIRVLYMAPQNYGPKNLLYKAPTGFAATMLGFPYDDLEAWRGIYPEEVFEEQFKKLSVEWKKGLDRLAEASRCIDSQKRGKLNELTDVAEAVYCHFRSTYLQIAFVRLRNYLSRTENKEEETEARDRLDCILDEESELAKELYAVAARDSRIGYEASNHYYYTLQDLVEKVICCEYLRNGCK